MAITFTNIGVIGQDTPITAHVMCGDGQQIEWKVDRKPIAIASYFFSNNNPFGTIIYGHAEYPDFVDCESSVEIGDMAILIEPALPVGVYCAVNYTFDVSV